MSIIYITIMFTAVLLMYNVRTYQITNAFALHTCNTEELQYMSADVTFTTPGLNNCHGDHVLYVCDNWTVNSTFIMSFFICAHTLHSFILLRYEVQASSVTSDYTKHNDENDVLFEC